MDVAVTNLTVDFSDQGIRALDAVDLEVGEGEQVALLGPSGSGKTTLLRALVGAVRPARGQVRVGGLDPFGPPGEVRRLRRATGFVRQRDDLVLGLSARSNAVMATSPGWGPREWAAVLRGRLPARHAARLEALARQHGVLGCLPAPVELLSGGQRKRIALVRALLPAPRLLLADEPTTGLDPPAAHTAVQALQSTGTATLVVTTHDLTIAKRFPRVVALSQGRVVHDGGHPDDSTLAQIYGAPA